MSHAFWRRVALVLGVIAVLLTSRSAPASENPLNATMLGERPLLFVENQGQTHEDVAYYVQGSDRTLYFTSDGLTISLDAGVAKRWTVKLEFIGANPDVRPRGEDRAAGTFSYFRGKPADWTRGVPTYHRIVYPEIWPGIDLAYTGSVHRMKYEFVVRPGADPSRIRLAYRGVEGIRVNEAGELVVSTAAGDLTDASPCAYQEIDGERVGVDMAYAVGSGDETALGFEVGPYDRDATLILDPVLLVYCGYIGGDNSDSVSDIEVDADGNLFMAGSTKSTELTFPVTVGPDLSHNGGENYGRDFWVAKMSADTSTLLYCGYIGGSGDEYAYGLDIDSDGYAYVVGSTNSTEETFPVVVGPDLTYNGEGDSFIAKVSADGASLVFCGYIGGDDGDTTEGVVVDDQGRAHVVGRSGSSDATFPVVVGPDLTHNGEGDAFVGRLNATGDAFEYCGYIGGSDHDWGKGVAVDAIGNLYVGGHTWSSEETFPVRVGPDLTFNGGLYIHDAFVAKVNPSGTALEYCGYIGGTDGEIIRSVDVDLEGSVYVGGTTSSDETEDFPVVVGPDLTFNDQPGGLGTDCWVGKVRADGTALEYCGYIGGAKWENIYDVVVDDAGRLYVGGSSHSSEATFPVIWGPFVEKHQYADGFVARVNPAGSTLDFCGYIGGEEDSEYVAGIAIDGDGNLYAGGTTGSTEVTFPVLIGPDLTYNGGDYDAFVAKISVELLAEVLCRTGTVNQGGEVHAAPVLLVNGSEGDVERVVSVGVGESIHVFMDRPPAGPSPAPFALYVWLGEPTEATVTPHPLNLGEMCFPTPITGGVPQPKKIWNNIGKTQHLGEPDFPSDPAPSIVFQKASGMGAPLSATFQGIILDDASAADKPASLTNAVVLRVQ